MRGSQPSRALQSSPKPRASEHPTCPWAQGCPVPVLPGHHGPGQVQWIGAAPTVKC